MRNYPTPQLRRKGNGAFFVRFAGKDHSLGSDETIARGRYAQKLEEWAAWRAGVEATAATRSRHALTVADLALRMFDAYEAEDRLSTARWFANHLGRWLNVHGQAELLRLTMTDPSRGCYAPVVIPMLNAFVADLITSKRYAPRTINHEITAIKRLFNFGADSGVCPPVTWRGVRRVPQSRSAPEALSPVDVSGLIAKAQKSDPRLAPWLRLNYFAMLRPSETVAIICAVHAGDPVASKRHAGHTRKRRKDAHTYGGFFLPVHDATGAVVEPQGLFELSHHKTLHKGHRRVIVLTDSAQEARATAQPVWSTANAYAQAARLAGTAHTSAQPGRRF